jgi:hypothetical protein
MGFRGERNRKFWPGNVKNVHLKVLGIGGEILLIWAFKNVVGRCGLYSAG